MPTLTGARAAAHPFAVPRQLAPELGRALAYWQGLLRGSAEIPFADDVRPNDLGGDLQDRVLLIDVFDRPERFRFAIVGKALPSGLGGEFLDETTLAAPLDFLRSQAAATTEAAAPTFFRREAEDGGYARLLLPLWGEGRIGGLLGVIAFD